MKKTLVTLALLTAAGFAFAQTPAPALGQPGSLVEVYGVIDGAVALQTNAGITQKIVSGTPDTLTAETSYGNSFGLSQGFFNGSRFGIRGQEDLGVGANLKAIYDLEAGVILPTGASDQQGQLFGRQAWVGVSSDYGKLTFGRTYGLFTETIGAGDVFGTTHGNWTYANGSNYGNNAAANGFFEQESGQRFDQSIRYDGNFNGFTLGGNLVLGGVPGQIGWDNVYAVSVGYNSKDFPVSGSVGVQEENDYFNKGHLDVGGGVKYALDPTDGVYAFYFHSAYDKGFNRFDSTDSEMNYKGAQTARTDDIASLSANYYATPQLNLIGAYYYDSAKNVSTANSPSTASADGSRNGVVLAVDYYVTKDFDVYLAGAYTAFSGVLQYNSNGGVATIGGGTTVPATPQGYTAGSGSSTNEIDSAVDLGLGVRFRF